MKIHLQKADTTSVQAACSCGDGWARSVMKDTDFEQARHKCKWCERIFIGRKAAEQQGA
jgi:hypothetical protein